MRNFFKLNEPWDSHDDLTAFVALLKEPQVANCAYTPRRFESNDSFNGKVKGTQFSNVSLSKKVLRHISFRECRFEDCLFIDTVFEECEFHHCYFKNCNFYKASFRNTFIDPETVVDAIDHEKYANIGLALFQELARDAATNNQHDFRATAEFYFRQYQRQQLRWQRQQRHITSWQYRISFCTRLVFEYAAGYGWKPSRLFATIVFSFLFLFLVNYTVWPLIGAAPAEHAARNAAKILYYTAGTVTTFGTGAIQPTSVFGLVLTSVEGMFGVLLLALAASIAFKIMVKS